MVKKKTRESLLHWVVAVTLFVLVFGSASPASAHARLVSSDPPEGTSVSALPSEVTLTYSEEVAPQFVQASLVPPSGEALPLAVRVEGPALVVDVAALSPEVLPGEWKVVARVVSVDGHPVESTTTFTVAPPVAPAPPEVSALPSPETSTVPVPSPEVSTPVEEPLETTPSENPRPPVAPADPRPPVAPELWWVLAALLVGVVAVLLLRRRGRQERSDRSTM